METRIGSSSKIIFTEDVTALSSRGFAINIGGISVERRLRFDDSWCLLMSGLARGTWNLSLHGAVAIRNLNQG
jgi:hypothetical protein